MLASSHLERITLTLNMRLLATTRGPAESLGCSLWRPTLPRCVAALCTQGRGTVVKKIKKVRTGKPRSAAMQPKAGREFERLASQLESSLAPRGAVVKSPDRIRDKFTGQLREVDASIRMTVGSAPVLIVLECRDRSRLQDTTWIEQIATKRLHIGATQMIAVSSKGFTDQAVKAADVHGILLRQISGFADEALRVLAPGLTVEQIEVSVTLGDVSITFSGQYDPVPRVAAAGMSLVSQLGLEAEIFCDDSTGRLYSLDSLVLRAGGSSICQRFATLPNATPQMQTYSIAFQADENFSVETDQGLLPVRSIAFEVTGTKNAVVVPPHRTITYSSPTEPIASFVEHRIEGWPHGPFSVISRPEKPA